jgi:ATP-binding cassette subfamily B protein RaxB
VSQEDQLLAGTIADNINFFAPDADDAKTHAAANMAQIHREIVAMPMGYHTMIGEMGAALSTGQKQRILLARAFYNDPTVLIFDEGTANLDAENEGRIVDIVSSLRMTRIVVSHRPALVEKADRVIRIDRGIISEVASGNRSTAAR